MTAIERIFLGWDGPALQRACGVLFERVLVRGEDAVIDADFSGVTVVTPGGRSGRLLLGFMLDKAESLGLALSPPLFVTPGELPGVVLENLGRIAGPVQRRLAWIRALKACGATEVAALLSVRARDDRGWSAVASLLEKAHDELIGEGIHFGDVAEKAGLGDREAERWRAAAAVQRGYRQELERAGLVDDGLARVHALEAGGDVAGRRVVLVGVTELSAVARRSLALKGVVSTSLIAAPQGLSETFDEFGCVIDSSWAERRVSIQDDAIVFAEGPDDQAYRAMEAIAKLGGRYAPHEIAIATPDEEVIPKLEHAAERFGGIQARAASGNPITGTSVVQLLRAIKRLREEDSFDALVSLIRHPDVERYLLGSMSLGRRERWLALLDKYAQMAIPGNASDGPMRMEREEDRRILELASTSVRRLLAPLDATGPGPLLEVMGRVYSGQKAGRDDRSMQETIRACETVRDAIVECGSLPDAWAPATSEEFIGILVEVLSSRRVPVDASVDAVELLGWLELPLDPSPVAIITGVNDGKLPKSFGSDPLLPDGVRQKLGIACSRSRMARDAFLLSVVANSRSSLTLICGRKGADGDPLTPSRLLFASDDDTVVERVRRFVKVGQDPRPPLKLAPRLVAGGANAFPLMPVVPADQVTSMRVTAFRTYLESPYRFYLEHVMKLEEFEPRPPELDRMQFGVLVHEALRLWGESDAKDSGDLKTVRSALRDHLWTLGRERYGADPAMAVHLQLEIAQGRLDDFARWQAERRRAGWRVERVEWKPTDGRALLAGLPFTFHIRGKIDRIDRHDDGSVAIIDYKTGDGGEAPGRSHGKKGKWKDLQLPLYRHLAAEIGLPDDPERVLLAYAALPREAAGECFLPAEWSAEDLADADNKAREVARRVHDGEFGELGPTPPSVGVFAALCGTAFLGGPSTDEEGAP